MSKKGFRKKWARGYRLEGDKLYHVGRYLKRYFLRRTTKRKHTGSKGGSGPSVCDSFNRALDIAAEKQKKANEAYKEKINSLIEE